MSEKYLPKYTPFTAQELIDCGWVGRVRRAVVPHGNAVRFHNKSIQAQDINHPERYLDIMLPNGGTKLTSYDDCALIVDMLEGKVPIPEPPEQ